MGLSHILSRIHTVNAGTMLYSNGGNNGHGLKNVTCKHTLILADPAFTVTQTATIFGLETEVANQMIEY